MVKKLLARFWELGRSTAGHSRRATADYESMLLRVPYDSSVPFPKKIHQTYKTSSLPPRLSENIDAIKVLNPDYAYRLWLDEEIEDFIASVYGSEVLGIYKRIAPEYGAARADFFRYLLLYAEGGVYLDIKSTMTKPLEQVIAPDVSALISHWDNLPGQDHEGWIPIHEGLEYQERGEYVQWVLVYRSGHPLLREVILEVLRTIDNYNPFVNSIGRGGVLSTTGPIPYTKALLGNMKRYEETYRMAEISDLGFVYSIYEQKGSVGLHKSVMPANYWTLSTPVVSSPSRFIQLLSTLALKLYYFILDNIVYRLQGKSR